MLHPRFVAPTRTGELGVVELPGRRPEVLDSAAGTSAAELLGEDHPVLLLLDEVERLRGDLEDREVEITALRGEVAQAYDRECDLIRILHRYVLAEQSVRERRPWWARLGRAGRSY